MSTAASNYAQTARASMTPRDLESSALLKAAARLQAVVDGWPATGSGLDEAITTNRKLWTIIASSVSDPDSRLPEDLRMRIGALANFIFNQTIQLLGKPNPEKLLPLILINRELAAGLRHRA